MKESFCERILKSAVYTYLENCRTQYTNIWPLLRLSLDECSKKSMIIKVIKLHNKPFFFS